MLLSKIKNNSIWLLQTIIAILFLTALIYFDRISLLTQPVPSGADPGNWLTAAWEIGGDKIRLVDWAYPPMMFVLLKGLLLVFNSITALKIIGILSWLLGGMIFFLIVRSINKEQNFLIQLGIAAFVFLSGYEGEIFAWGGYPQLLATSFLLLVFPSLENWFKDNNPKWLFLSILGSEVVIYTHHFMSAVMIFFLFIMMCLTFVQKKSDWRIIIKKWMKFLITLFVLAIPSFVFYWRFYEYLDLVPTNPQKFSFSSIGLLFTYVFQNQQWIWLVLLTGSIFVAFFYIDFPFANTVIVFVSGSLILLFILWEVRLSQLLIIGVGFGLILIERKIESIPKSGLFTSLFGVVLSVLLIVTLPVAKEWFIKSASFYQVVDNDTLDGLNWIKSNTSPGDIIAASPWKPHLIGWWIEGYTKRPCIYSSDPRWLSFSGEKKYAIIANDLFQKEISINDAVETIREYQIKYLFIDKSSALPSEHVISSGYFQVVFENSRVLILQIIH